VSSGPQSHFDPKLGANIGIFKPFATPLQRLILVVRRIKKAAGTAAFYWAF